MMTRRTSPDDNCTNVSLAVASQYLIIVSCTFNLAHEHDRQIQLKNNYSNSEDAATLLVFHVQRWQAKGNNYLTKKNF